MEGTKRGKYWRIVVMVAVAVVALLALSYTLRRGTAGRESSGKGALKSPPKVAIFNLLSHPILNASIRGIIQGLAKEGYSGDAVRIQQINANGEMDKLDAFARELLSTAPDVIVPVSTPVAQAVAKDSSPQQEIVFSTVTNPADIGFDSTQRNMTGVSDLVNYKANIDLLQELVPQARTIGMVYNPSERNSQFGVEQVRKIVEDRNLTLKLAAVAGSAEVEDAASSLVGTVDAFYVGSDNTVVGALPALLKVANGAGKVVIASDSGSVQNGALAAVSVDYEKLGEVAGELVARILRGRATAKSIAPVSFLGQSLILNGEAAKKLGLTFPPGLTARADRIIQ